MNPSARSVRRLPLLLFSVTCLSGCFGTVFTRSGEADFVGRYPFEAVAADVMSILSPRDGIGIHGSFGAVCIVAIPFDLATDAIFLPADLFLWPLGFSRKPREDSPPPAPPRPAPEKP